MIPSEQLPYFLLGLTGGIASGKSAVSNILEELGARIVCADRVSREVVLPGNPGLAGIVEGFGRQMLLPDGTLDRAKLGACIFSDVKARQRLDAILHPCISQTIDAHLKKYAEEDAQTPVVLDAALLIETGRAPYVDALWVVSVDPEVRIARLMQRDACDREAALARIRSQMDDEQRRSYADRVLWNNGTLEQLEHTVRAAYAQLPRK